MSVIGSLLVFALIGIGGTIALDLWALLLARTLRVPPVNWPLVGRWIGHMPRGRFVHSPIARAAPVAGEAIIGWSAHYLIGVAYGFLLFAFWGRAWLDRPALLPPLLVSWTLLVAPYFVMMPGMGLGMAGRKTPKPNITRFKSMVGHSVFGLGMYVTGIIIAGIWPLIAEFNSRVSQ